MNEPSDPDTLTSAVTTLWGRGSTCSTRCPCTAPHFFIPPLSATLHRTASHPLFAQAPQTSLP